MVAQARASGAARLGLRKSRTRSVRTPSSWRTRWPAMWTMSPRSGLVRAARGPGLGRVVGADRPLREHRPRPTAGGPAAGILCQPQRRPRTRRPGLRPAFDQIGRADLMLAGLRDRARHGTRPAGRPAPSPTVRGSSRSPAATPKARQSASSWTQPPPTSPCSRSPHTLTNARPTSAKWSGSATAARRLLRQAQPRGHRHPRDPGRQPATRGRTRLPPRHRARR